jgi:arylsulfatase A-like enzyme
VTVARDPGTGDHKIGVNPALGAGGLMVVGATLYEFAGIDPNKSLAKKPVLPMIGVSFKRYLTGEVQPPQLPFTIDPRRLMVQLNAVFPARRRLYFAGELFNLHDDPLETHDVAAQHPDRVKAMSEAYEAFASTGIACGAGTGFMVAGSTAR